MLVLYNHLMKGSNGQFADDQPSDPQPSPSLQKALQILIESHHELTTVEARYRAVVESERIFICRMLPDGTITYAADGQELQASHDVRLPCQVRAAPGPDQSRRTQASKSSKSE